MMRSLRSNRLPVGVLILVAAQAICATFFLNDVLDDYRALGTDAFTNWHFLVEAAAALMLLVAIGFSVFVLVTLLRRQARLEKNLSIASAAMHDVIEALFIEWGLTPAEADVANFMVKGMSIAEIAALRGNAEGTVKSHLNAIYRKSGTQNRGEVLSLIIDNVIGQG